MVTIYYCEVHDTMRKLDDIKKDCQVVELPPKKLHQIMKRPVLHCSGVFIVGYYWFYTNYKSKFKF